MSAAKSLGEKNINCDVYCTPTNGDWENFCKLLKFSNFGRHLAYSEYFITPANTTITPQEKEETRSNVELAVRTSSCVSTASSGVPPTTLCACAGSVSLFANGSLWAQKKQLLKPPPNPGLDASVLKPITFAGTVPKRRDGRQLARAMPCYRSSAD